MGKIPTLLFGPGDVNVGHIADEYVRVDEILLAARAYILAALRFLS
jgi:acetylornithine deacetylase/succinyl-diaminopimelate desuccinylase